EQLKVKRAWDLAISPAKSLPMQAFMLYMSGGGVHIFSMGIVFMLLSSPFKNLASINSAFAQFAPKSAPPKALTTLLLQKVVYLLCNLLTLALGLWKCRSMGLLPTGSADWLAFETRGEVSIRTLSRCGSDTTILPSATRNHAMVESPSPEGPDHGRLGGDMCCLDGCTVNYNG
ncbi:DUF1077-domain-containing protein, partial [Obba rivulosa]